MQGVRFVAERARRPVGTYVGLFPYWLTLVIVAISRRPTQRKILDETRTDLASRASQSPSRQGAIPPVPTGVVTRWAPLHGECRTRERSRSRTSSPFDSRDRSAGMRSRDCDALYGPVRSRKCSPDDRRDSKMTETRYRAIILPQSLTLTTVGPKFPNRSET